MSVLPVGFGASGGGYQTERSLRFRASASANLSRTPGASGNRKLLARRFRIKLGTLGTLRVIASAGTASIDRFYLDSSDRLCLDVLGTQRLVSNPLRRDPTAWYVDVEIQLDVANATAAQRAKILVDGVELTYASDSRASITNTDTNWNNTVIHYIGRDNAGNYFDGYVAEPIGVDGSTSSTYTSTDPVTTQLVAARPSATWGTTGYSLDFSDATSLTTLMADRSGNGNNWTANNISLTAGATYDSMLDVPLGAGGNERGNYCTLNPLASGGVPAFANVGLSKTYADGNLGMSWSTGGYCGVLGTIALPTTGKWWWEVLNVTNKVSFGMSVGSETGLGTEINIRVDSTNIYVNGSAAQTGLANYAAADTLRAEWDADNNLMQFFKGASAYGAAQAFTPNASLTYFPFFMNGSSGVGTVAAMNFGQRPPANTPTTGFKALHTGNLTNTTPIASDSFTGNLSTNGPSIWCNGTPETLTINGNAVTWGTHADKLATGFKVRSSSSSYNSSGTNTWTATYLSPSSKSAFKYQNAKGNP